MDGPSAQKDRPSTTFCVGLNPSSTDPDIRLEWHRSRHSARRGNLICFPESHVYSSVKFYSQTGWGSKAGISPLNPSSSVDVLLFSTYSDRLLGTLLIYSVSFCLFDLQKYYAVYFLSLSYSNVETT